jgi:iron(III) transport system permease protein
MTIAAPALSSSSARPARVGGFDATWLLWIAIIAVLLFLVVSPFVYLVVTSFTGERTGGFTLANYGVAWGRARYVEALFNSLRLGAVSAGLAGLFAIPLAWGVSRTNMPGRGFVRMLVLATFITPPYTGAVAWILLAGPNAGWLNRFYMFVTGAEAGPSTSTASPGLPSSSRFIHFPTSSSSPPPRSNWCPRKWRTPPTSWAPEHGGPCGGSPCRWLCRRSWVD